MSLGISPDVPHIKKSIRYQMQHLMQIDELLLKFLRIITVSLKMDLVILSITVTCCPNVHILINSPLKKGISASTVEISWSYLSWFRRKLNLKIATCNTPDPP